MPNLVVSFVRQVRRASQSWGHLAVVGALGALTFAPSLAPGAGPADSLFRLVPPESGVVLAVEDFRTGFKQIEGTPFLDRLNRLPMVASWLASDRFDRFRSVTRNIEAGLGWPARTIIDEVLGDAVVLVLQPGANGLVNQSSGLVLIKPRQIRLLEQLVEARNVAQAKRGGLIEVIPRKHREVTYRSRLFKPGGWPSDHYVILDDGTFAWSNSEASIIEVIDRRAGIRPAWDASPSFRKLRQGLPNQALASLFIAPNISRRVLGTAGSATTGVQHYFNKVAESYLGAVQSSGFALEWQDGLVLHSHDVLDVTKLPPWLAKWLVRPSTPSPLLSLVPSTAFGVVSAQFDFAATLALIRTLVTDDERTIWETTEQAAQGLLLGQSLDDVLAKVEPHLLVTLGPKVSTDSRSSLGVLAATRWVDSGDSEPPWRRVDNAVRTSMAFYALRPLRRNNHFHLTTETTPGGPMTRLGPGDRSVLAFQANRDRFVISNNPESIAHLTNSIPTQTPNSPFASQLARSASEGETFAVLDLPRVAAAVVESRQLIVRDLATRSGRSIGDVDRDLGQMLALAQLFQTATFSSRASRDATEVHRTVRLIIR